MNSVEHITRLAELADKLDRAGYHDDADLLTETIIKTADNAEARLRQMQQGLIQKPSQPAMNLNSPPAATSNRNWLGMTPPSAAPIPAAPLAGAPAAPSGVKPFDVAQSAGVVAPSASGKAMQDYLGYGFNAAQRKGVAAARAELQHHMMQNGQGQQFINQVMSAFENQIANQQAFSRG